jgi:hypothetical protein
MKHAKKHHGRSSRRSHKHHVAYLRNPATAKKSGSKARSGAMTKSSASDFLNRFVRGAAAGAAFELVGDLSLNMTSWAPTTRGAVQGVAGLLLGLALHKVAPNAALGVAIVGVADLISGGVSDYRVQSYIRSLTSGASTATTPAGQAWVDPMGMAISSPFASAEPPVGRCLGNPNWFPGMQPGVIAGGQLFPSFQPDVPWFPDPRQAASAPAGLAADYEMRTMGSCAR